MDKTREALAAALSKAIEEIDHNTCTHESTHRGGAIWTICDDCGRKWADDEGGFQPYEEPAWLTEAREHAMDASTSDEKHGWFGKYKGRINNFLAQAGIDMKQAEKDMFARKKAKQDN